VPPVIISVENQWDRGFKYKIRWEGTSKILSAGENRGKMCDLVEEHLQEERKRGYFFVQEGTLEMGEMRG